MKQYYVYILAGRRHGTLYIGMTSDLIRRVSEHRQGKVGGFTRQYRIHRLVYFETTSDVRVAIEREKQMKKWNRCWKVEIIEKSNPTWRDLYREIAGFPLSRE